MYFNEVFSWQAFCEVFETTQLKIGLFLITQRRLYVITCDQSNVIILSFLGKLSYWENIHIPKYCYSYIKSKNTTWPRRYINSPSERSTVLRLNFERTNLFLNFSFQQLGIKIFLSKIRCTHLINRPSPSTTHTKLKSVTLFLSPLCLHSLNLSGHHQPTQAIVMENQLIPFPLTSMVDRCTIEFQSQQMKNPNSSHDQNTNESWKWTCNGGWWQCFGSRVMVEMALQGQWM